MPNLIACEDCKCAIRKENANKVVHYSAFGRCDFFYCGRCKKPYKEHHSFTSPPHYFAEVEVDIKGNPIKK